MLWGSWVKVGPLLSSLFFLGLSFPLQQDQWEWGLTFAASLFFQTSQLQPWPQVPAS